jgi:hypothetical protein
VPRITKKRQAGVAKARQIDGTMACASTTLILAHRYVANPVQTIFDAPVTAS